MPNENWHRHDEHKATFVPSERSKEVTFMVPILHLGLRPKGTARWIASDKIYEIIVGPSIQKRMTAFVAINDSDVAIGHALVRRDENLVLQIESSPWVRWAWSEENNYIRGDRSVWDHLVRSA